MTCTVTLQYTQEWMDEWNTSRSAILVFNSRYDKPQPKPHGNSERDPLRRQSTIPTPASLNPPQTQTALTTWSPKDIAPSLHYEAQGPTWMALSLTYAHTYGKHSASQECCMELPSTDLTKVQNQVTQIRLSPNSSFQEDTKTATTSSRCSSVPPHWAHPPQRSNRYWYPITRRTNLLPTPGMLWKKNPDGSCGPIHPNCERLARPAREV